MPEGPEIRRAADKLAKALEGEVATEVWFAFEHLAPWGAELTGRTIVSVKPRGKALVITFDNGMATYSHNQLYGRWDVRTARAKPLATNRQPRLRIRTAKRVATLYSASDIAVLMPGDEATHPFLARIGPDVFEPGLTPERIKDRLREKRFARKRFSTLALAQDFLAGLGNYLRSETLYMAGLAPDARPIDVPDEALLAFGTAILWATKQSYAIRGVTVPAERVEAMKAAGKPRWIYRHFIFGKEGFPCPVCETPVVMDRPDGRRVYRCPRCQAREWRAPTPFELLVAPKISHAKSSA